MPSGLNIQLAPSTHGVLLLSSSFFKQLPPDSQPAAWVHANHRTPGLRGSTAVNAPVVLNISPVLCSENVVFIFLVHPFDVGDTLLLCTTGGGAARHDVSGAHCFLRLLACLHTLM